MVFLLHDIRYGLRMMVKNPGMTIVALLTLALGIGANTALFTLMHANHLIPRRFADPERLAFLWSPTPQYERSGISPMDFFDWREQTTAFAEMGLYSTTGRTIGGNDNPESIRVARTSANVIPLLGFDARLGRLHTQQEDQAGADPVVVLTDKLWERRYDRSADVLGKTVLLNDKPHTIIGVLPPEVDFERLWWGVDAILPLGLDPATMKRDSRWCTGVARLAPHATFEQAQAELDAVAARLAQAYPDTNEKTIARVEALLERFLPVEDTLAELGVGLAVAAVLLIACVNLANMLLARATSRSREFAVRAALGAGRMRIIRQLLVESMLLAAAGAAIGVLLAVWAVDLFAAAYPEMPFRREEMALDRYVLGYTMLVSLLAALAFGLAPALVAARAGISETLKEGGLAISAGIKRRRWRNALVVGQLAVSMPLFVCCGLATRHVRSLREYATFGFEPQGLLTVQVELPYHRFKDDSSQAAYFEEALAKLEALPGIESAGAALALPVGGYTMQFARVAIEGQPIEEYTEDSVRGYQLVTPGYFTTMQTPLIGGRFFTQQDHAETGGVALVNQRMAKRYWPDENPIDRRVQLTFQNGATKWFTVVGVVGDTGCNIWGEPPRPTLYLPHKQKPYPSMAIVARTTGDPVAAAPTVRAALQDLDPGVPVFGIQTFDSIIRRWLRDDQMLAGFLGGMAALALVIAAIGLYGVMAYNVVQRTHEIGVRVALGAGRRDILWMVLKRCMVLAGVGIGVGFLLATPIGFLLASFLYGVGGADPVTFIGVTVLLMLTALAAGYLPARRATAVNPMTALRHE